MSFPFRVYHHHDMKEWLARLLSHNGLEDIMDLVLKHAATVAPSVMSDVWDAPIFRDLSLNDGTRFVEPPPKEGRYIFGLAVNGFNPFSNKQAKQQASVTAIYLYCLNLPPHLSAQKYFFVCTLTVAAWDTLVLSPRTWRLLRTKEWPPLKILFHFLRLFMPIEFTIVGQYPSIQASVSFTHWSSFRCCIL